MQVENCRARIPYPSLWVYSPVKRQQRMIGYTCRRQRWRETGGQPTGRIARVADARLWWRLRTPPDALGRRVVVNPRGWLNVCRFTGSGGCCEQGVVASRGLLREGGMRTLSRSPGTPRLCLEKWIHPSVRVSHVPWQGQYK
jgi:hypothetical protein